MYLHDYQIHYLFSKFDIDIFVVCPTNKLDKWNEKEHLCSFDLLFSVVVVEGVWDVVVIVVDGDVVVIVVDEVVVVAVVVVSAIGAYHE